MANSTVFELTSQPHPTDLIRCQRLVYQLTQSVSNTTDLETIFELALQGLEECLALHTGSLLLFKYTALPQVRTQRVDPCTTQMRVAHHRQRPLHAVPTSRSTSRSRAGRNRETLTAHNLDLTTFLPVARCDALLVALQLVPYSLMIQVDQVAALCSGAIETECPAVPGLDRLTPREARASLGLVLPLADRADVLITPIANRGKPLGCLVLQRSPQTVWQEWELGLVEIVATQLSAAILQVQTLRQVQSVVDKRTAQLQRSMDVQSKLYEQTRRQIDQLRHLNQLKDDFLNAISHELRTPLTSIRLAVQMLRQPQLSPERRAAYLDILEQQCRQEIDLINDLLTLQRVEGQAEALHLHPVDFAVLLHNTIQAVESLPLATDHPILVEAGTVSGGAIAGESRVSLAAIPMHSQADSLERIIRELLINACKYSSPGQAVQVAVEVLNPEAEVQVTLTNIGLGILADELAHIFEKFRRGQAAIAATVPGTGLGLALVHCLVTNLGGSIQIDSVPLDDSADWATVVVVTLPQFTTP